MTRSIMASHVALLHASAIVNGGANAVDGGGRSDSMIFGASSAAEPIAW